MRSGTTFGRLVTLATVAILMVTACGDDGDSGAIPGWPGAERMSYDLVTDCESANAEEFCGEFIELMANGYGGYLQGGDIVESIQWEYATSDVIEIRYEGETGEDGAILELTVVGTELHEVGTDRVFVSSPEEDEAEVVVPASD